MVNVADRYLNINNVVNNLGEVEFDAVQYVLRLKARPAPLTDQKETGPGSLNPDTSW